MGVGAVTYKANSGVKLVKFPGLTDQYRGLYHYVFEANVEGMPTLFSPSPDTTKFTRGTMSTAACTTLS